MEINLTNEQHAALINAAQESGKLQNELARDLIVAALEGGGGG